MAGENKELAVFKVVSKMSNGDVHSEEFMSECAVPGFSWLEPFRKETKWLPHIVDLLLEDGTNSYIRSIGHETQFSIMLGMGQHGEVCECCLDLVESRGGSVGPVKAGGVSRLGGARRFKHVRKRLDDVGALRDETAVEIHQAEELTKFGEGGREGEIANSGDFGIKWLDAMGSNCLTKELEGGNTKNGFGRVDYHAVLVELLE